jgi:hypothetical protein
MPAPKSVLRGGRRVQHRPGREAVSREGVVVEEARGVVVMAEVEEVGVEGEVGEEEGEEGVGDEDGEHPICNSSACSKT